MNAVDLDIEQVRRLRSEIDLLQKERDYYKSEADSARTETKDVRSQLDSQLQLALRAKQQLQVTIDSLKKEVQSYYSVLKTKN